MLNGYTKPNFVYWSDSDLNAIEAQMSGGGGWSPQVEILGVSYDNQNVTITYEVNSTIPAYPNVVIGYEYAGDFNVWGISNGILAQRNCGIHTVTMEAKNYFAEMRPCVGYRNSTGRVSQYYSSNKIFYHIPTTRTLYWEQIATEEAEDVADVIFDGVTTYLEKSTLGKPLAIYLKAYSFAGELQSRKLVDFGVLTIHEGNYYRLESYYENEKFVMRFAMWNQKIDYLNGNDPDYQNSFDIDFKKF